MKRWIGLACAAIVGGCSGNVNDATLTVVFTRVVSLTSTGGPANERSTISSVSADGRYVVFDSLASNLTSNSDTNGASDVFLRDVVAGTTVCLSLTAGGTTGDGASLTPDISADGQFVAFVSVATNLVADDTDVFPDVYRIAVATGAIELVSRPTGLVGKALLASFSPALSDDGRYVAFSSNWPLDAADGDTLSDIYRRDTQTNTTVLVSRANGFGGTKGNGDSIDPDISGDGAVVAFETFSGNLDPLTPGGAADTVADVIWRNVGTGVTQLVMYQAFDVSLSQTGRYAAFCSDYTLVVGLANDLNQATDVFVRDMQLLTAVRVSVHSRGNEGVVPIAPGQSACTETSISSDGRYVAYSSLFQNLVDVDTNQAADVFVHDTQALTTTRVSVTSLGVEANSDSLFPAISGDANFVCFSSLATNLGEPDTNAAIDLFVRGPLK